MRHKNNQQQLIKHQAPQNDHKPNQNRLELTKQSELQIKL